MFTGHIDEVGTVMAVDRSRIVVNAPKVAAAVPGSICVNGVGLTVVPVEHGAGLLEAGLSALARRLADAGAEHVLAIDASERMLAAARRTPGSVTYARTWRRSL
jgi:riboflavin synthase alpha subunit